MNRAGRRRGPLSRQPPHGRDVAFESARDAVEGDDPLAPVVRREPLQSQLVRERQQPMLGGARPLSPEIDPPALGNAATYHPPADPAQGLEHDDRPTRLDEVARRRETSDPATDDDHVDATLIGARSPRRRLIRRPPPDRPARGGGSCSDSRAREHRASRDQRRGARSGRRGAVARSIGGSRPPGHGCPR